MEEGGREEAEEDIEKKVGETGEEDMEEGVSSSSSKMTEERSIGGRTAVHEDMQHAREM